MKSLIKKAVPISLLNYYHKILAQFFAFYYGNPSKNLVVIGVTGTNGKSTTVNLIAQLLDCLGHTTGFTSTINFKVGAKVWLNDKKMTMLGRGQLQRFLRQMVKAGCQYAIIETASEGIRQLRHTGIAYDVMVFTNLTPEHIESHGSFDNYKTTKKKVFEYMSALPRKQINGKVVSRVIAANGNDQYVKEFIDFPVDTKIIYGLRDEPSGNIAIDILADKIILNDHESRFNVQKTNFTTSFIGRYNIYNIVASLATIKGLGFDIATLSDCVHALKHLPGRFEFIEAKQPFKVLIDYAPEPTSLKNLYQALDLINYKHLIHILGSAGGGRDKMRRQTLGKMAGKRADIVIVTNEDPYDENPEAIIKEVATGAHDVGKTFNKNLFMINDRKEAMAHAFYIAQSGDMVLITGKGSEQAIVGPKGKKIPWDDRRTAYELLAKMCG